MLIPFGYLLARAFDADAATLHSLVWRPRNLLLLTNTLKLTALVLAFNALIALPLAWLTLRSDLKGKGLLTFLCVMPLAIPGYVMAYAILGMSGYYGFANQFFGVRLPRLEGLWGAATALSLYTFPYMFLNLRSALAGVDPGLIESARSLGRSRWGAFWAVEAPHLRPALLTGSLVVGLYVLGDFGVVALMRYEAFSWAIYTQYSSAFDRTYAAWLSLMLMALTLVFVWAESAFARNRRFARVGTGVARPATPVALGAWRVAAWIFLGLVFLASLGLPLLALVHWMLRGLPDMDWAQLGGSFLRTIATAAPAALLAVLCGLPVALLAARWPSRLSAITERLAYLGYALPPLAFALAMVFFTLRAAPALYQSFAVLIFAYVLSFLALTLGPLRLALWGIGTRREEAARALGSSGLGAFLRVTLPQLRRPMAAGGLLVFIMICKELPITYLLAPTGYTTLSMNVFSRTSEGMMAEAAPFALALVLFSSLFVGLILRYEGSGRGRLPEDRS
ncbi:iron ABC transporter permease [Neomegalonema sp.]|uniref:ABC transporter permease n=1 Tax=Neomegalonema sp. TaxID=2039713 RepID=UPI0026102A5A|nr:iron ABC transporter permease [Neomegalonema sp.]MDD2869239.1 iron ABC transporter permease [Neomegalonema sp.]